MNDEADAAGDKQNTNRVMSFGKRDDGEERALGRETRISKGKPNDISTRLS